MSSTPCRLGRRLSLVATASALTLCGIVGVHAQEAGLGGFFQQLFGARPAPVQPAVASPSPAAYGAPRRSVRHAVRPRVRYASLPADPDKVAGKQPVDSKAIAANPTAAVLRDGTLRPGDIVVLSSGPKVFIGSDDAKRHRMSDFEDVKSSRAVDGKTRAMLLAMMVPHGAMPASEARKYLAQARKLAPPAEIAGLEQQARNEAPVPRIITPWQVNR